MTRDGGGLKLFFYYSLLDWHHPDYWPRGRTGRATGRPEDGDWTRYLDFMDRQQWNDPLLSLPSLGAPVSDARMLETGEPVPCVESASGVTLSLPPGGDTEPDRVVVVRLKKGI